MKKLKKGTASDAVPKRSQGVVATRKNPTGVTEEAGESWSPIHQGTTPSSAGRVVGDAAGVEDSPEAPTAEVPGTVREPGTVPGVVTAELGPRVPARGPEPGTAALYTDIGQLLADGLPAAEAPEVLRRSDGVGLFYSGQVNLIFGDPESGKSWVALAAAAEALREGGTALVLDLDHNGPVATTYRLSLLGAPLAALGDLARFRYVEPEDSDHLEQVVADVIPWRPTVTVLDSVGELIPLFRLSSNSPDDFTLVHGRIMKPLAVKAGTALIAIDHLAKNSESRAHGATGTAAKRRAVGGVSVRATVSQPYVPGRGGATALTIHKDRHGGLRASCSSTDREPLAGTFSLAEDKSSSWELHAPTPGETPPRRVASQADVDAMAALDPPAKSVDDAQRRLRWRRSRAAETLRAYRSQATDVAEAARTAVPGSGHPGGNPAPSEAPSPERRRRKRRRQRSSVAQGTRGKEARAQAAVPARSEHG